MTRIAKFKNEEKFEIDQLERRWCIFRSSIERVYN